MRTVLMALIGSHLPKTKRLQMIAVGDIGKWVAIEHWDTLQLVENPKSSAPWIAPKAAPAAPGPRTTSGRRWPACQSAGVFSARCSGRDLGSPGIAQSKA